MMAIVGSCAYVTAVVTATGFDAANDFALDVLPVLVPLWDVEDGWELEWTSNEPDFVNLREIYEHFRRREMTRFEYRERLRGRIAVSGAKGMQERLEEESEAERQPDVALLVSEFGQRIEAKLDALIANATVDYVTIKAAAVITSLSQSHIRRAIYSRELSASNQGSDARPNWRIARTDLAAWMKKKGGASKLPPKTELNDLVRHHLPGLF